jgi:hypothetical protein
MPAIEAMAIGLPVVATQTGGLKEIVVDGTTGLLVDSDDASSLAEALLRILNHDALARAMGEAGRERVERMFSWESIAEIMKAKYESLCREDSAADNGDSRPAYDAPRAIDKSSTDGRVHLQMLQSDGAASIPPARPLRQPRFGQ